MLIFDLVMSNISTFCILEYEFLFLMFVFFRAWGYLVASKCMKPGEREPRWAYLGAVLPRCVSLLFFFLFAIFFVFGISSQRGRCF